MKKQLLLIATLASASIALQAMERELVLKKSAKRCAGKTCHQTSRAANKVALCCFDCANKCDARIQECNAGIQEHDTNCPEGADYAACKLFLSWPRLVASRSQTLCSTFACWARQKAIDLHGGPKLPR